MSFCSHYLSYAITWCLLFILVLFVYIKMYMYFMFDLMGVRKINYHSNNSFLNTVEKYFKAFEIVIGMFAVCFVFVAGISLFNDICSPIS